MTAENHKPLYSNKFIHLFLGIFVSGACLYWAVKDINWTEVWGGLAGANYGTVPVYILFLLLFFILKAFRWSWLLIPVKSLSAWSVTGPMMVGFMGNNVLPAHIGEIFRVVLLGKREQVPYPAVFTSVAVERMLDVFAVLILVGIGMLTVQDIPPSFEKSFLTLGLGAIVAVIGLMAGLIWIRQAVQLAEWFIGKLPLGDSLQAKLKGMVASAAQGTVALKNGKLLAALITNSLIQWSLNCSMIAISLYSFGIQVPFSATLILLGVLVFAVTIPSTPGFFGAIQLAFVKTLSLFGVAESAAFSASIYYHLIQYLLVTGAGLVFLSTSGFSLSSLNEAAEEFEQTEASGVEK